MLIVTHFGTFPEATVETCFLHTLGTFCPSVLLYLEEVIGKQHLFSAPSSICWGCVLKNLLQMTHAQCWVKNPLTMHSGKKWRLPIFSSPFHLVLWPFLPMWPSVPVLHLKIPASYKCGMTTWGLVGFFVLELSGTVFFCIFSICDSSWLITDLKHNWMIKIEQFTVFIAINPLCFLGSTFCSWFRLFTVDNLATFLRIEK